MLSKPNIFSYQILIATFVLKGNNMWNILFLFSLDATIKDFNKYSEKHWNFNVRTNKENEAFP